MAVSLGFSRENSPSSPLSATTMGLNCWEKTRFHLRKLWIGVAARLRIRRRASRRRTVGLLKLQQDVSRCEYEDVHVMWEMLKREDSPSPERTRKRTNFWSLFGRARWRSVHLRLLIKMRYVFCCTPFIDRSASSDRLEDVQGKSRSTPLDI